MFKSKKEFALAMLEGRRFTTTGANVFLYDASKHIPFRWIRDESDGKLDRGWDYYNSVKEILPWHDNIPKYGVLCWVSDADAKGKEIVDIIVECTSRTYYSFISKSGRTWFYATPITEEEIAEFFS